MLANSQMSDLVGRVSRYSEMVSVISPFGAVAIWCSWYTTVSFTSSREMLMVLHSVGIGSGSGIVGIVMGICICI